MLYYVVAEEQYNLAYFFVKRIECARANPTANLPYGMFLTRLYRHIMEAYPHLDNGIYDIVDRVMRPLALKQTWRPRSDRGKARHSVSSSSSHHHGTPISLKKKTNHMNDDDDDVDTILVQVLHLLPPILTLLIHSTTKTTKCLPLNKPKKLSLKDKPPCSTKTQEIIRKCAEFQAFESTKECLARKKNEDIGVE
ncbi:hypothetical protein Tco_0721272 [Tanacetum coccineum]